MTKIVYQMDGQKMGFSASAMEMNASLSVCGAGESVSEVGA